jgi:sRNA-binding regulator protein Hfq
MRWDRLFADLEAEADDIEKAETDGLAIDLRDEIWAATSWRDLLGGHVMLDVTGVGQIGGHVAAVNDCLLRVRSSVVDHLVACSAVTSVLSNGGRSDPPGRIDAALGWPQALRRLRDAGQPVRVVLADGRAFDGQIEVVGADFVRLGAGDVSRLVTLDAVAVVTSGR